MVTANIPAESLKTLFLEQVITVWNRKWLALLVAWTVCIVGWAGVMFIPQRYESNARAFVDVDGLLTPLLKGLIVNTTPAESESYLRQTLLSRPNLEQVIVLANLGGGALTSLQREELVDALATEIKVTTEGDNLVSISYSNNSPTVARDVVDALLTIFAEKAANSSRTEMDKARAFLTSQIQQYEVQLRASEQRRAAFRKQYAAFFNESGVARPEVLQQQVAQLQQQYEDALTTRNALNAQLKQIPELLSVDSAPTIANSGQIVAASPEVRLAQARRHLADLKLVDTAKHPDVITETRTVADLQAEVDAERKTGGSAEGKNQISNPAYEQLRLKLVDIETAIPAIKERLDKATADYGHAKSLGAQIPDIEAKSLDIDRDYEVIKQNYDELVKRRESANLSQAADDRADRTQFRVIDPPQVPIFPAFPNRFLLLSLVTLVAIGVGIASPIGLSRAHPTYASVSRLRTFGLPVLGAITSIPGPRSGSFVQRLSPTLFVLATGCLFATYGGILLFASHRHHGFL
jgi:polysaccharide chain length determinant protein (PEP-CTERM system associated)